MNQIAYTVGDGIYLNLTNRCPCRCVFCIRQEQDTVGDSGSLWLKKEPTTDEVLEALASYDLGSYREIVFCGYGEPMEQLDVLLEVCRRIRAISSLPIRVNTNGLADLIHKKPTAPLLEGLVDTVSISLNAPNRQRYHEVVQSIYGLPAFDSMLQFAVSCKSYVPHVMFTVVDILSEEEIAACRQLASGLGIPLRVREKL
ncbi:TIGR04100 family radical SAM protein [Marasmitruncus massiliensis]|uniref:TIGR04100 family radical SAM protein n=1 Tax=Marasmitruncus massiliensis TaxID=1944642 RepID=UPI000C7DF5C6|nr:TIGR04100 family radical SAM protein [Marasmitruncus massiliensis]